MAIQEPRYRELISACLEGKALQVSPVGVWRHHPVDDQETDSLVAASLHYQKQFDPDWLKLTPAATWQVRDYGLVDAWQGDGIGRRDVIQRVIKLPDDWSRLAELDPLNGFSAQIVLAAGELRRRLPAHIPLLATVFSPLSQAVLLAGAERVREHAITDSAALMTGLSHITRNTLKTIHCLAASGIDGIFYAMQQAGNGFASETEFLQLSSTSDNACLSAISAMKFNLVHLHGSGVHPGLLQLYPGNGLSFDCDDNNIFAVDGANTLPKRTLAIGPGPVASWVNHNPISLMQRVLEWRLRLQHHSLMLAPGCAIPLAVSDEVVTAFISGARLPLHHHNSRNASSVPMPGSAP